MAYRAGRSDNRDHKGLLGLIQEFCNYTEDSRDLLKGFDLNNVT